ncbi:MAG: VOC family protein [Polyangiales bacterium]|nr:VOC family protein [Myxococcales bacterium]
MSRVESLGIKRIEAIHYYVHDIERSRRFYRDKLDFQEFGKSSAELEAQGKQTSYAFRAGDCTVICSAPKGEGGRAWRWLQRHPDGVGTVVFEVEDVDRAFRLLDARGGTPIDDIQTHTHPTGTLRTFSITTPFGSSTFRFVERRGYVPLMPGMEMYGEAEGGTNRFGFTGFDHITSNFETMSPALLWLEHVLGFEPYWQIQFHTEDVAPGRGEGSGLRSRVYADPNSDVKFANNEPMRPYFKRSQINLFAEDMRGDGIQHVAINVKDIVTAVRALRESGVAFMPTPGSYYDYLPERIQQSGILRIDESIDVLRDLEVLIDGAAEHQYLLQIFLMDSAGTHQEREAGPFFFELIQRKGDRGFGGGNFRALFESIERQQRSEGRV